MNKVESLLLEREYQGLRNSFIAKGIFFLSMFLGTFSEESTWFEEIFASLTSIVLIVAVGISLIFIRQKKYLTIIGSANAVLDCIFIALLNIIWYISIGGADVSPGYLLKTSFAINGMVMMTLNSLALRPLYPIIFTSGFAFLQILFFIYAYAVDPQMSTNSYLYHMMGDKVSIFLFFSVYFSLPIIYCGGILIFLTCSVRKTIVRSINLEKDKTQMQRYFSPGIVEKITQEEESFLKPGGVRQQVAVMFCDIRGFTAISESLPPEKVVSLLSKYHKMMVDIIFKYGGTLDKYIGDAIMATFGTPEPKQDDPVRAVHAALAMREALQSFNAIRRTENQIEIRHGIGINYGDVIAGNIGTSERLEYTVIGDTVNTASRMESLCKKLDTDILISESTMKCLTKDILLSSPVSVTLRGKSEPIQVYSVKRIV